jgi:hypothetical protein
MADCQNWERCGGRAVRNVGGGVCEECGSERLQARADAARPVTRFLAPEPGHGPTGAVAGDSRAERLHWLTGWLARHESATAHAALVAYRAAFGDES